MTDNIDAIMNDKNSTCKIHNEPETSSNDYNEELKNDEEIKFDLANITEELKKELTVEVYYMSEFRFPYYEYLTFCFCFLVEGCFHQCDTEVSAISNRSA